MNAASKKICFLKTFSEVGTAGEWCVLFIQKQKTDPESFGIEGMMKKNSNEILLLSLFLLIAAFLWSCEELGMNSMQLTNNTRQMTYYQALTVEASHLIDLNPAFSINTDNREKRIIPPGDTATLYEEDISGYDFGDDVKFFFYEVVGDSAYISGGLELTHKQLLKLRFHVVIDDEELTTRYE